MTLNVNPEAFKRAVVALKSGKIIAYPTEGVYGLGCSPHDEKAVMKILNLKNRSVDKGLILIAASIEQIKPYIGEITDAQWSKLKKSWPGPTTWVVPKSDKVPQWISGAFDTVAVRVTAHLVAQTLCKEFGDALVSTSANKAGEPPLMDNLEVYHQFGEAIDYIVPGRVGDNAKPTTIIDLATDKVLR